MSRTDEIDALLPQTQCGECGYAGCRPYAKAMAAGEDTPNHCPPGGVKTLHQLGDILNIDVTPYLAEVEAQTRAPAVAVIREDECIGCTKCIQACPVDAIIGSAKLMHTVISQECTGCELCIEPCPVDCIDLVTQAKSHYSTDKARQRHLARQRRQVETPSSIPNTENKLSYIQQAIARQHAKKDPS